MTIAEGALVLCLCRRCARTVQSKVNFIVSPCTRGSALATFDHAGRRQLRTPVIEISLLSPGWYCSRGPGYREYLALPSITSTTVCSLARVCRLCHACSPDLRRRRRRRLPYRSWTRRARRALARSRHTADFEHLHSFDRPLTNRTRYGPLGILPGRNSRFVDGFFVDVESV